MWEDFSLRIAHISAQVLRYRAYYCRKAAQGRWLPSMRISRRMGALRCATDRGAESPTRLRSNSDNRKSNSSTMCSAIKPPRLRPKAVFPVRIRMTWALLLDSPQCRFLRLARDQELRTPAHCRLNSPGGVSCSSTRTASIRCCCSTTCSSSGSLTRRRQDFVLNRISAGQVMITCCEDGISREKLRAGAVL